MPDLRPTLRRARMPDRDAIESLMRRSVRALCIRDYSAEQIAAMTREFGFARPEDELIHDGTYFVAELAGAVVGCGGWSSRVKTYYMRDDDTGLEAALPHPASGMAAIRAIFVAPDMAGRGVGRLLVRAAEASARNEGYGAFEIGATLTGVPLYRKLGYRASGLFSFELTGGSRFAVVMMHKRDRQSRAANAGSPGGDALHGSGDRSGGVAPRSAASIWRNSASQI